MQGEERKIELLKQKCILIPTPTPQISAKLANQIALYTFYLLPPHIVLIPSKCEAALNTLSSLKADFLACKALSLELTEILGLPS
jgi:hypothetical protein